MLLREFYETVRKNNAGVVLFIREHGLLDTEAEGPSFFNFFFLYCFYCSNTFGRTLNQKHDLGAQIELETELLKGAVGRCRAHTKPALNSPDTGVIGKSGRDESFCLKATFDHTFGLGCSQP